MNWATPYALYGQTHTRTHVPIAHECMRILDVRISSPVPRCTAFYLARDSCAAAISRFWRVGCNFTFASRSPGYCATGYFDGANEPGGNSTFVLPSRYCLELSPYAMPNSRYHSL